MRVLFALLSGLVLLSVIGLSSGSVASEPGVTRIIVLGDTGTGEAGQYEVKDALLQVCAARGCDFAIITGDLIYGTGASSVDDPEFVTKFEAPYADVPMKFYLTLGNHDNSDDLDDGLGTDSGKGDIEVAYHYRTDTSQKWFLPARTYAARVGDVELFSLDTNSMMSYGIVRKGLDPRETALFQDPTMIGQASRVASAIAASTAPWKIAFGHHPLYSNGQHGNAGAYESQGQDVGGSPFPTTLGLGVKLFLEEHVCDEVDLYLAGHDHDLQWLEPNPSCGSTELIVSGAGAKARPLEDPTRNPARYQRGATTGFWWLELTEDTLRAAAYDSHATLLHEQSIAKPLA